MKKLLIIISFLFIAIGIQAQGFHGFFFPVKDNLPNVYQLTIDRNVRIISDSTYNLHLIRFGAELGGVQILYNKVTKEVKTEAFLKTGIGLRYSFYKVTNGIPYNYLSLNGFVFLPLTDTNQSISVAFTVSAFNLFGTNLSPSVGVNFEPANIKSDYFWLGPLLNLTYNF